MLYFGYHLVYTVNSRNSVKIGDIPAKFESFYYVLKWPKTSKHYFSNARLYAIACFAITGVHCTYQIVPTRLIRIRFQFGHIFGFWTVSNPSQGSWGPLGGEHLEEKYCFELEKIVFLGRRLMLFVPIHHLHWHRFKHIHVSAAALYTLLQWW